MGITKQSKYNQSHKYKNNKSVSKKWMYIVM